jgi:anti-sigma B factor antagonist
MTRDGVGRIDVDKAGPTLWLVALTGEHDLSTVTGLEDALAAIFAQGTTIVVDLSGVTFMDSSVLRHLIVAQRRADSNDHEHMAVVAPAAGVAARLIEMVDVGRMFSLYETRADALRALEQQV